MKWIERLMQVIMVLSVLTLIALVLVLIVMALIGATEMIENLFIPCVLGRFDGGT